VTLAGEDITGLGPHIIVEKGIARTFQNLRLFPNMTLMENLLVGTHTRTSTGALGAVLRTPGVRHEEAAARERALEVLSIFGNRLMPRREHLARTLSYANRRRLEIARAVITEPVLLLLDEPTAGMNPTETLELTDQIRGLERPRYQHPLDRAQAQRRQRDRREGDRARPRREDRRGQPRRSPSQRGSPPCLSRTYSHGSSQRRAAAS